MRSVGSAIVGMLLVALGTLSLRRVRWAYPAFVALCLVWIPSRTGFQLQPLRCTTTLTIADVALAATKWAHVVLFVPFALITASQFARRTPATVAWTIVATVFVGFLAEFEQGMTRTGDCRVRDLVPDLAGAVLGVAIAQGWHRWRARQLRRPQALPRGGPPAHAADVR